MQTRFEYRTEHFPEPPTAEILHSFAVDGWRLVSVTVDMAGATTEKPRYVVYLERPVEVVLASMAAPVRVPVEEIPAAESEPKVVAAG